MSECELRGKCHANCDDNWWCRILHRAFHVECRTEAARHDLQQPIVEKVLDDSAMEEVPVDKN
jgi:hypothetical protein